MLQLKNYQDRAIEVLSEYLKECVKLDDANKAFYSVTKDILGFGVPYHDINDLPSIPYVCLRIPTGGGKTLVACHSIHVIAQNLLHTNCSIVLWLVPSNTICEQTLNALKNRLHPYRQALEMTLGTVSVLDIEEALYVKKATIDSGTTIIVSTLQSFRVEETEGRKVYRNSGQLMDHFMGLPPELSSKLDRGDEGNLYHSLANVLSIHRPIVVVDEAHNARTDLSFDTLQRINPSCIIEFTATPAKEPHPSNVLYSISAAELKAEDMIKMPIRLETKSNWKELLSDSIACRERLEKISNMERQQTGEYVRPILLIQAQAQRKGHTSITVDVVLETLLQDHNIPREHVAVATGSQYELDKVKDVQSPECLIRYIITIQALREGWDCPFAYVLCSIAEMRSSTYVEQILGRVLRLPKAKSKQYDELNLAYAFAASVSFTEAANALADALVENGFEKQEVKDLIVPVHKEDDDLQPKFDEVGTLFETTTVEIPEIPKIKRLPPEVQRVVSLDAANMKLTFLGSMSMAERETLKECFSTAEGKAKVDEIYRKSNYLTSKKKLTPAERKEKFSVPILAIQQGDLLEVFESTHFLDHAWSLLKCDALLTEDEYSSQRATGQLGEVFIDKGRVQTKVITEMQEQMVLLQINDNWTVGNLVHWLDRSIPHKDISPDESGIFLTRAIQSLMEQRGFSLEQLVVDKYRLKDSLKEKIDKHRKLAHQQTFQLLLDPGCNTPLIVSPETVFTYNPKQYPYNTLYKGRFVFQKHYYPQIGDLKEDGEEVECAQYLDQMEEVEFWVRNLSQKPDHSFWIQTSTDRFYPDFVCKLKDGRYLVVEYKGEDREDTKDTKEKQYLGELWEKRSNGQCLFLMLVGKHFEKIKGKVA